MITNKEKEIHPVVTSIRKIMNDNDLTQATMAEYAKTSASQFSKILKGDVQISLWQVSNIAKNLQIRVIDIFTYPDKYQLIGSNDSDVKAQITLELKKELKEEVLKLVFGDSNLEILKK